MSELKAVLGPTNTGKTHYAIERMLAHGTGMIGLPLRLLAREVYDRIVAAKGPGAAALVTGEERIWPPGARYFACTVEAMPTHVPVDFVAIDEIQLAEDPDRGHIFTDRLLRARGTGETLLLGAETMRPILRTLGLATETEPRVRFSDLAYAGPLKITKLPKRTAIIAFSAEEVYAIGELLRRQKGGAAIIMGALSPRTRNAQVDLYQSGEVDYLVATDAIGMGLNLDVDHIAFASSSKFDGRRRRRLSPAEIAQIAGRAGRFRTGGTFGETATCPPFEEDLVARIVNHAFDPVERIEWRNAELSFDGIDALLDSLARPSGSDALKLNPHALDEWTLRQIAGDADLRQTTSGPERTRRLWDICRLPDFRKAGHEGHLRIVQGLVEHLADPDARLSDEAMANRMERLDSALGDIPAIQERLAAIRTWAYAAQRDDWLDNPGHWREKARELEDRLSDTLHEALTARFVDRRTRALMVGLGKDVSLMTEINPEGEITVEGHVVGRLVGLRFEPASTARTLEGKAVRNAALGALLPILSARLAAICASPPDAFSLNQDGQVYWNSEPVAVLTKGTSWLKPDVRLVGGDEAAHEAKEPARLCVGTWIQAHIASVLPTLTKLASPSVETALPGAAKGLCFRLAETGAAIDLRKDDQPTRLEPEAREALKLLGVRAGRIAAHIPDAQKPAAQGLVALLRSVHDDVPCPCAPEGAGSFDPEPAWTDRHLQANGYLRLGTRAVRADLAERLAWQISRRRKESGKNLFALPPELASIVSCPGEEFPEAVKALGLVPAEKDPETGRPTLWRYARRVDSGSERSGPVRQKTKHPAGRQNQTERSKPVSAKKAAGPPRRSPDPSNPFAALAALLPEQGGPKGRKRQRNKTSPKASMADTPGSKAEADTKDSS